MRDPIGFCSRVCRPGTAQAQNDRQRSPRLEEYAEAQRRHDQVRVSLHLSPRAGDGLRTPSVSLGLGLGRSFSVAEIKDAKSSDMQELRKTSNLPERPHSCSGCVGTLASHRTTNEYGESLPNPRHPRVTNLGSFFESVSKQGLKAPGPRSPRDLSLIQKARLCPKKELGSKSVDEQHAVVVQTKDALQNHEERPDKEVTSDSASDRSAVDTSESNSKIHGPEYDDSSKYEPSAKPQEKSPDLPTQTGKELGVSLDFVLPMRTRAQVPSRKPLQMPPRVEKRIMEREDEELEAMLSKKTRRRAKIATTLARSAIVAETTKTLQSVLSFKPTPSRFLESKLPNIDHSAFEFVPRVKTTSCGSPFARLLEPQPEIGLEIQQTYATAVPFVSALETFDATIPGCNAMQRFETMQNELRCLADTKAKSGSTGGKWSGTKCNSILERVDRDRIGRLLLQLDQMNIYTDGGECNKVFDSLASEAICYYHEGLARRLFKSRVRELSERRVQEQEATRAARKPLPVKSDSDIGITWWLRSAPYGAMHYLPEYRPFSDRLSVSENVNRSIRNQARQPLVTKMTRSANGLTEHDETRDGYIYVYWNRASFGHWKIGFTGKNVDQRLREWEEQCQHIAEKLYQSPRKIKHAARVEKLIHTEFANHRVSERTCHGCGKEHIEWFRGLDLKLVIQRIEAWSQWISESPYEHKGGVWRLKEDPEFELPLPSAIRTEAPQTPEKPRAPRSKSSSPRQKLRPKRAREQSPSP